MSKKNDVTCIIYRNNYTVAHTKHPWSPGVSELPNCDVRSCIVTPRVCVLHGDAFVLNDSAPRFSTVDCAYMSLVTCLGGKSMYIYMGPSMEWSSVHRLVRIVLLTRWYYLQQQWVGTPG